MKSKNIVFVEQNVAALIEEPIPPLKSDQVRIQIAVTTVSSGTERANLTGSKTVSWYAPESEAVFPRRSGYSAAGTVIEIGDAVKKVKVGDRVCAWWSTHNQHLVISENTVFPIDDMDFEDAAMLHIATFPLAAIRKCRLEIGESAIVMGMGILGLLAVPLLKAAGAAPVIAVDPVPEKRQKAIAHGADYAFDPFENDFVQQVKAVTDGGANVGIEVTGVGAGLNGILDCMALKGRVALLGCTRSSDFTVDYYRKVHGPGITLVGAHTNARPESDSSAGWWTQLDDIKALIKLTRMGRIHLSSMIDETHSPEDAPAVYTRLVSEKAFPIVQFDWRRL